MKFNKTDLVFETKLDYFSSCCHAATVAVPQLRFSCRPKTHVGPTRPLCSGRFVPTAATFPPPLWDPAVVSLEGWGSQPAYSHPPYLVGVIVFHWNSACPQRDVQTGTLANIYLSSSCLEKPPKAFPWLCVLNKKSLRSTASEYPRGRRSCGVCYKS